MTNQALVELNAVDNTAHAFQSAQNNLKQFDRASRAARQQLNNFERTNVRAGGSVQQLGYQIQDIAVQLQSGASPFIVLSQQGSQVASIFGPGGAVVGAMLSIGGVIGMTLLPQLFKTEKQTETLEERVNKLGKSYDELGVAQQNWLRIQQQAREADKAAEIAELEEKIRQAAKTQELYAASLEAANSAVSGFAIDGLNAAVAHYEEKAKAAKDQQAELNAELETANAELAALKESYQELVNPQKKAQEEVNKLIEALKEEAATYGMSDTAIALYTANKNKATEAQLAEVVALRASIDAKKEHEEAEKAATKAAEEAAKAKEKAGSDLAGLQQSFYTEEQMVSAHAWKKVEIAQTAYDLGLINAQEYADLEVAIAAERQRRLAEIDQKQADSVRTAQEAATRALSDNLNRQVNSMAAAFDESSAIGKAFYVAQQGMAAANAVISGLASAASIREAFAKQAAAVGAIPGAAEAALARGEMLANLSIGLGVATAGAIAGQTLASFDGGGFTGHGARAGGMDGKGGFAAILHPNETVIDHTKGGATQVNVTIQANDTRGFDQLLMSRRGVLAKLINDAVNNKGRRAVV